MTTEREKQAQELDRLTATLWVGGRLCIGEDDLLRAGADALREVVTLRRESDEAKARCERLAIEQVEALAKLDEARAKLERVRKLEANATTHGSHFRAALAQPDAEPPPEDVEKLRAHARRIEAIIAERRLALLPGLRWSGHMVVGDAVIGGYVVDWDAVDEREGVVCRHVMDRCVLTAAQIRGWTGVDLKEVRRGE